MNYSFAIYLIQRTILFVSSVDTLLVKFAANTLVSSVLTERSTVAEVTHLWGGAYESKKSILGSSGWDSLGANVMYLSMQSTMQNILFEGNFSSIERALCLPDLVVFRIVGM